MSQVGGIGTFTDPPPRNERDELRRMSNALEGIFLSQLFQAMQESIPEGGVLDPSYGQDLFTSLLHERLASEAADRMSRGIGDALYRQLSRRLPAEGDASQD